MGPIKTNDPAPDADAQRAEVQHHEEDAAAARQKASQAAAVETAKTAPPAGKVLVSGQHGSNFAHIKLNGKAKTVDMPVTGRKLHLLAGEVDGHPITLKSGGSLIPNTDEPVDAKFLEFTTK